MKRIDPNSIKKILFITLSNIGDAILTTPSLDLARRFFARAKITVMAGPRAGEVFEGHPHADRLIIYDKQARLREKLSLILKLKEERFDLVIDLRHTAIPLLIQPRYATPLLRRKGTGHAALRHLERLKAMGIEGPCGFVLPPLSPYESGVRALLARRGLREGTPYVALGPGAASPLKRWGLLKFKALAERLRLHNIQIVVVGPGEDAPDFRRAFSEEGWINLTGELTLLQLGALLKRAALFVTNDSGPMHLAAALGASVLAIFGPTDPAIYGPFPAPCRGTQGEPFDFAQGEPYGNAHRVVRLDIPCSPCMAPQCQIKTHECLERLEVDAVYETAREMLKLK